MQVINLARNTNLLKQIISDVINKPDIATSAIFLSNMTYEAIEATLTCQMGASTYTKYGDNKDLNCSIAISYEQTVGAHYIQWITVNRKYIYNFENVAKGFSKIVLYDCQ